jgi:predicted nucleic acid-binding protein
VKVSDALQGVSRLFLDTAPVIYHLEKNPSYLAVVTQIFTQIDAGAITAVTSPITLAECLVRPLRQGDTALAQLFEDFIVRGRNTTFAPIGDSIATVAAEVRAQHNLVLADAFQVSVATNNNCEAFLTNDHNLKRVTGTKVIVLDDLEP